MNDTLKPWYTDWFNEDYLKLYKNRDDNEAIEHVNFITRVCALKDNERILDVGCGIGRHALIWAKRNFNVVGIDRSEKIIQKAKEKAEQQNIHSVQFICDDIRNITPQNKGTFDLVVSLFTSFGHEELDDDNQKILHAISSLLAEEGVFFIDYLNPTYVKNTIVSFENLTLDDEQVSIRREIIEDQVIKTISISGKTYQEKIKLYSHQKMKNMLNEVGLAVKNCWSNYQGTPFTENGARQLIQCVHQGHL